MEIASNWPSENFLELDDIVQKSTTLPTGDLIDLLDEDKCISLVRKQHGDSKEECKIEFAAIPQRDSRDTAPPKKCLLKGLKILSEARIVEVFIGFHQEYHGTVHGTLMGDFGDSKIFSSEVQFDKPQEAVVVKLKGTCSEGSVWIYGLHVAVTEAALAIGANCKTSFFSGDHLASVFKEKGVNLSKDADRFRQVLEGFNRGGINKKYVANSPVSFMSMMFGARDIHPCLEERELDVQNGNDISKSEMQSADKKALHMSELFAAIENHLAPKNTDDLPVCNSTEKEAMYNIQNTERHLKVNNENSCEEKSIISPDVLINETSIKGTSQPVANIMDKLQALSCDDRLITKEIDKFGSLVDLFSKSHIVSKAVMDSPKSNSDVQYVEGKSVGSIKSECKCGNSTEVVLDNIETIVDRRLASMEERLLKKIDEKLAEKSREESLRMKRVEELFIKIFDKL